MHNGPSARVSVGDTGRARVLYESRGVAKHLYESRGLLSGAVSDDQLC